MKRLFLVFGTAVVILLWLSGARAKADLIQWSIDASGGTAGQIGSYYVSAVPNGSGGAEWIEFTYGGRLSGTNSGSGTLLGLQTYLDGMNHNPSINFTGSSQYQLNVRLFDTASGDMANLTFRGYFSGNLPYYWGDVPSLTNTFVGPTTQTLALGRNLYSVTIGPVNLPAPNESTNIELGSIGVTVDAQPNPNLTPEPSSLALACLSLPPLGLAGWFRRRRA